MTKDECLKCGGFSTLRFPCTVKCLDCGHTTATSHATRPRPLPPPEITVSRYRKEDGFPTRHFAIHVNGALLAVTVYRKGAEAVRAKLMEMLAGRLASPAMAANLK